MPPPMRWTVSEFHLLRGMPAFENRRMILVGGEIHDLPNPNPTHDSGIGQTEDALRDAFGAGYWVRVQMALVLGQMTDPVPDLAVVPGPKKTYTAHPTGALLVVEIADSSLVYDTGEKANLYAACRIADYWVLDLNNRLLHVFRDPVSDPAEPFGFRYGTHRTVAQSGTIAPLAVPQAMISVANLLP
jgi:hypothetical protein